MSCQIGSPESRFKLQQTKSWGQGSGRTKVRSSDTKQLVGVANEVNLSINKVGCTALIDTGATVSTISEDFYEKCLSHIEMYPV